MVESQPVAGPDSAQLDSELFGQEGAQGQAKRGACRIAAVVIPDLRAPHGRHERGRHHLQRNRHRNVRPWCWRSDRSSRAPGAVTGPSRGDAVSGRGAGSSPVPISSRARTSHLLYPPPNRRDAIWYAWAMSTGKQVWSVFVGVSLIVALSACGDGTDSPKAASPSAASPSSATTPSTPLIRTALQNCDKPSYPVGDGGKTLTIDTGAYANQSRADAFAISELDCLFQELDMPTSVRSHVESTRALDGMQTADWAGWFARWTYHPDSGLNMIIEDRH